MDRQEVFNKVFLHAKTMTGPSVNQLGSCYYRSPEGNMCLVGALITNEVYSKSLEFQPASSNIILEALKKSGYDISPGDDMFLQDLQEIHDNLRKRPAGEAFTKTLLEGLRKFAENEKLTVPN